MPAKSSLRDEDKKLTDFFSPRPSASVPASATSAPAGMTTMTRSATRKRTAPPAILDSEPSMDSNALPQVRSAPMMTTRKRARSPSSNNPSTCSLPPSKLKFPRKPMIASQPVIYASSPDSCDSLAQRPTPGRPCNSAGIASPLGSSKQVVFSSQSDEVELALPISQLPNFGEVAESVHAWRRKASESSNSSAPCAHEDVIDVELAPKSDATPQTPTVAPACLPSPPDTKALPPLPPTPEPIDSEAKTAKLIAEIKARAFAANQSSDDEQPLSFHELEDSDDGDLIDDLPLVGSAKGQGPLFPSSRPASDVSSASLTSVSPVFDDATIGRQPPLLRPTRASMRSRKPAPAFRLPLTITKSSIPVNVTNSVSSSSSRKKSLGMNPLHALLREKESEKKRGTGCAAIRLAEEAIGQDFSEASVTSDDDGLNTMNQLRLADEQAAWKVVHESRKSTSPVLPDVVGNFTIGDHESAMLGSLAGEAINKILACDKVSSEKENTQNAEEKVTLGVSLWVQPSDEDMEVDSLSIPPLSGHSILVYLDGLLRSGDTSLLDLTLRAGVLDAVPSDIILTNIIQFLNMALFAPSQVADAVSFALRDLWGLNPPKVHMPFAALLFQLVQLGANPSVLERLGLTIGSPEESAQRNRIAHETLLKALKRLLAIVKVAGFTGALSSDEVANVVLILVIVGLDPLTSSELRTQLNITIDVVCNHGAADYHLLDIHEKVLSLAKQLDSVDKSRLISFFASGSGRTRFTAQRLAYCLLVSTSTTSDDQAPPLEPLILLLSPDARSCELFDVTNESTNYEELGHHVDILSVALTDIAPYLEEEHTIMKSSSNASVQGSPNRSKKSPAPPLELLRRVLEALQSKIIDTRATHLDRSKTKAAIQRLTMRIYFDRMALIGARPRRRASTLEAYFSPQAVDQL